MTFEKMTTRAIKAAALLLCAALALGCAAASAEARYGDLVYVPAMSAPEGVGSISLTVEGLTLGEGDEPEAAPLAGAEFGVYVYSSAGELTPWADPLYPAEPMRIRSGEGETLFSLPSGMEFYLKQDSAPQGYLFDPDALIPIEGDRVVVQNAMPGELVVRVADELGTPVQGARVSARDAQGERSAVTDENGEAVFPLSGAGAVDVREDGAPEGAFAALYARVSDADGERDEAFEDGNIAATANAAAASRARVTFTHAAPGTVRLSMRLSALGDDGEAELLPLPGVRLEIAREGAEPYAAVSDEAGEASLSLPEGTYEMRLSYAGDLDAVLPAAGGTLIVSSGKETAVELNATESTGRVAVQAQTAHAVSGGSVTLKNAATGETFGPYAFDADGLAVSDSLAEGDYAVGALTPPEGMELGELSAQGRASASLDGLTFSVAPGALTAVSAEMLSWEEQTFELIALSLSDEAKQEPAPLTGALTLSVVSESGQRVGEARAEDGRVTVSQLTGAYTLQLDADTARTLGLSAASRAFTLPSGEDAIVFMGDSARLVLYSADENGMSVPGAQYAVTDGAGMTVTVRTDDSGVAVTPPLMPGEIRVENAESPEGHDAAQSVTVTAGVGDAPEVTMNHPTYGEATVIVRVSRLDGRGEPALETLEGAGVRLYRLSGDGAQMTDTGLSLVTDGDGAARVRLPAGEYVAQADEATLGEGVKPSQAARFALENGVDAEAELVCMDALGGVRATLTGGELTAMQMAQVAFELVWPDGSATPLKAQGGSFYAQDVPEGTYVLRQTRIPLGYTLASERTVGVSGGEVSEVSIPLEEYAVVSVSKTGLTFNDQLQTFVVPLPGEYGVFVKDGEAMKPYPSEAEQATVWANVSPEQESAGRPSAVKLPAAVDGTTYYLKELGGADGFSHDEEYHEVVAFAGERAQVDCAVSSDRGFFRAEETDAHGVHAAGGEFELLDASGEQVLTFTMGDEPYQNPMALPVGEYTLRQTRAAEGCALPSAYEVSLTVEPYLTRGGSVAVAALHCARVPEDGSLDMLGEVYAAREQGITMISVDGGRLGEGETLRVPQMTLSARGVNGERVNAISLVLPQATDAAGARYRARVEYALSAGGWQPGDAILTDVLDAPAVVNLSEIEDDVTAVRVTYLNADTGLEDAGEGFAPGSVTLGLRVCAEGVTAVEAEASFGGSFAYRTEPDGEEVVADRQQTRALRFDAEGDGAFGAPSAGRDGRVSGAVFFDENEDGLREAGETRGCANVAVTLVSESGDELGTQITGEDGLYAFDNIPAGAYTLRFIPDDTIVFSHAEGYSEHTVSGVFNVPGEGGESATLTFGGDHTDAVVNAGCIYASELYEYLLAFGEEGLEALVGVNAEARRIDGIEDEEPIVVLSDEDGRIRFSGLMPGRYEATVTLPEGYVSQDAPDGKLVREVELAQGERMPISEGGEMFFERAAAVSGRVCVDDDGDGAMDADARGVAGVRVTLSRVEDGHSEEIAETATGADGAYRFDGLFAGEYTALFSLSGLTEDWCFTRGGTDSLVTSGMTKTGGTDAFALEPGMERTGVNAGVTIPAQLTVIVFEDTWRDGQFQGTEPRFEGASVTLVRVENGESGEGITYRTDADGSAFFAGVSPGEYRLRYQLPGAWRATVAAEPGQYPVSCVPTSTLSSGESAVFTLSMGQRGMTLYIGAMLTGTISGTAFYDDDANASRGEGEGPAAGVSAQLLDQSGAAIGYTETAEDGSYAFEGLAPGRYRVRFTAAGNCAFAATERSMSRGGAQASQTNVTETRTIPVRAGEATVSADAAVVRLASLAGTVWEDRDGDARQGEGERGLYGAQVQLMNGAGRSILATATTDANGAYRFDGVMPGEYLVRVDAPEGYVFSGALAGGALPLSEVRDGRGYTAAFSLLGGASVERASFGLLKQGSVGGRVWQDQDYDGVLDEEEDGLRYAAVTLLNAAGETVGSVQTGRSGEYAFGALMPGEYTLRFTLPEGYVFTCEGGDSRAPRIDGVTAEVPLGALDMGQALADVNVGALMPAAVGGVVFLDVDDDGRRQAQDTAGSAHVTLEMLTGADAGKRLETDTDDDGAYLFAGVMPGQATLTFDIEDGYAFARNVGGSYARRVSFVPQTDALTASTGVLDVAAGADLTYLDVGLVRVGKLSGVVWEDAQYDGKRGKDERGVPGARIRMVNVLTGEKGSETVSGEDGAYSFNFVRAGTYAVEVTLPEGMIFTRSGESAIADTDADAARTSYYTFEMGRGLSGLDFGAIAPCAVEGRVVYDMNQDGQPGEEEPGLSGAVVTALQGGTVVATTKTGADGRYALEPLRPGEYRVRISLSEDALFAVGTALTLADEDALEGETAGFTLAMGERRVMETVAAVPAASVTGRTWLDQDADGLIGPDEPALTGVTAELFIRTGDEWTHHALARVGADGRYAFKSLRTGLYCVLFTLPDGMLLADRREGGGENASSVNVIPGNRGATDALPIAMGERLENVNAGGILPGSIGDTVWLDTNKNGLQDYREPLQPDVHLSLLRVGEDGATEEVSVVVSDEYGYYRFNSLRPGSYVIRLDDARTATQHVGAPLGEIDSDLDPATGQSDVIRLVSGQTLLNIDVGLTDAAQ